MFVWWQSEDCWWSGSEFVDRELGCHDFTVKTKESSWGERLQRVWFFWDHYKQQQQNFVGDQTTPWVMENIITLSFSIFFFSLLLYTLLQRVCLSEVELWAVNCSTGHRSILVFFFILNKNILYSDKTNTSKL